MPEEDRDQVRVWFDHVLHREPGSIEPSDLAAEAGLAMAQYVIDMVAERRRSPATTSSPG